jgi:hypothetical protein
LERDTAFRTQLSFLNSLTNLNYENGFVKGKDANGQTIYEPIQGGPNQPYLPNLSFSSPVDGIMHSHFAGGFSIFSPGDIRTLYNTYNDGMAAVGFSFAVTTSSGTYVLQVSNVAAFLQYGAAHLVDEGSFDNFQLTTYVNNGIWELESHDWNENAFLKMLRDENMGLTLLSSESPGFNEWNVKGLLYGSSINVPC